MPEEKLGDDDEEESIPTVDSRGQALIQRYVLIQRDERGYGLTVSGDNPVYVQSVKENGAAAKVGVQQGDRIIKVNGTLVTNSNHTEVVKLIKSGSYVTLTLLGRPPGGSTKSKPLEPPPQPRYQSGGSHNTISHLASPGSGSERPERHSIHLDRISSPSAAEPGKDQELKSQKYMTLRMMYDSSLDEYEQLRNKYSRNPSDELQGELNEAHKRVVVMEKQLNAIGFPVQPQTPIPYNQPVPSTPGATDTDRPPPSPMMDAINENEIDGSAYQFPTEKKATPWLKGGTKHTKTRSMPEELFHVDQLVEMPITEANVVRSHSDVTAPKLRKLQPADSYPDLAEQKAAAMEKSRTVSLPSSASYESGSMSDSETNISPPASPSLAPITTAWSEENQSESMEEIAHNSSNDTEVSVSVVPPSPIPHEATQSQQPLQHVSPHQVNVISMEDEEFSTDDEHVVDHGSFSDMNMLSNKPAHLAVFMHYLISNSDPSPLFFHLITEQYQQGSLKEMKKWAYEIHSTFLVDKAPLRMNVEEGIVSNVENILLHKCDKEDAMRSVFHLAKHYAKNEIADLLADFRTKRALGLGSIFGDHELSSDNMDRATEIRIIDKYLWPHFDSLLETVNDPRNHAMTLALATFLKQVGVSRASIERHPSFVSKDKKIFKFKTNKKMFVKNHLFQPAHYHNTSYCCHCGQLIWGVGYQGFQCSNCETNAHRQCVDHVQDVCQGSSKTKMKSKRSSMLDKINAITRKPSQPNPAAMPSQHPSPNPYATYPPPHTTTTQYPSSQMPTSILYPPVREAQRQHEEKEREKEQTVSPTGSSVFHIHSALQEEEESQEKASNRVNRLKDRFEEMAKTSGDERSPGDGPSGSSNETLDKVEEKPVAAVNLNRSESLDKKQKKQSRVRRTRSDVAVDNDTISALSKSGSSSSSSLSPGSIDSPSNSTEAVNDNVSMVTTMTTISNQSEYDSDFAADSELPSLDTFIPKDVIKKLKPKEKKRQEVINELFHTEINHVRNLKILDQFFEKPMAGESWISWDFVKLLFPNLQEVLQLHSAINTAFKAKKNENINCVVGDIANIFLASFKDESGEKFRNASAKFCKNQTVALETLKHKRRKDQKLNQFLDSIESNPLCRKLQLKDFIPVQMQRLTKYPLLIENLMKYTSSSTKEYENLKEAHHWAKSNLAVVNQAVKECENVQKLREMQRRLDRTQFDRSSNSLAAEFKDLDLTKHNMIHEGNLVWRISKQKQIDLHVLLFEDILVLLQKQDDKLVLKFQSTTVVAGNMDTKFTHSPIIKLTNLLTRNVATDPKAFFLVSTSSVGPQIYELVSSTKDLRKKWFKYITEAAEAYKGKGGKATPKPGGEIQPQGPIVTTVVDSKENNKTDKNSDPTTTIYDRDKINGSLDSIENIEKDENIVEVLQVSDESQTLIHPNEVVVSNAVFSRVEQIHTAGGEEHPTQDPLSRKDELDRIIDNTMAEKKKVRAEILNVPVEAVDHITEFAIAEQQNTDPRALLLATESLSDQLTQLVSKSMGISEVPVASEGASGGKADTVTVPTKQILDISSNLRLKLSRLMEAILNIEEEAETLRKENKAAQDLMQSSGDYSRHSRPDSFISVTSSTSDALEDADESGLFVSPQGEVTIQESAVVHQEAPVIVQQPTLEMCTETVLKIEEVHEASMPEVKTNEAIEIIDTEGSERVNEIDNDNVVIPSIAVEDDTDTITLHDAANEQTVVFEDVAITVHDTEEWLKDDNSVETDVDSGEPVHSPIISPKSENPDSKTLDNEDTVKLKQDVDDKENANTELDVNLNTSGDSLDKLSDLSNDEIVNTKTDKNSTSPEDNESKKDGTAVGAVF
ncbi:unnamed protein product [Owenia fusiformis]|uniref:Uncharacterized protein n=1 Tax=Owenia fusiformis TaxID=6347 RepID=A0A8S4PU79_OWEFU|nr:unnamed protein product [Owenia fusiformis]